VSEREVPWRLAVFLFCMSLDVLLVDCIHACLCACVGMEIMTCYSKNVMVWWILIVISKCAILLYVISPPPPPPPPR
jgi:hypothetical protein